MTRKLLAAVALAGLLAACRSRPVDSAAQDGPAFAAPAGKRAFSLSIDKSQTKFLTPGSLVEVVLIVELPRSDGARETRSEVLAPRAEVLRLRGNWAENTGLVQLAMTP